MARRTGNKPTRTGGRVVPADQAALPQDRDGVQPWHLLVLGMLAAGAAGVLVTRGTGTVNMVFVAVAVASAGLVAAGFYRSLSPLVSPDVSEQIDMLAGRTRAALEREKMLVLRSIKEVEFDRAMRKISDADYLDMVTRLRARAVGLIRQLDGGGGYRELIERDLAARMALAGPAAREAVPEAARSAAAESAAEALPPGTCARCATVNDRDARFCKSCGTRLTEGA